MICDDHEVRLRLGPDPIQLPEPLATLIRRLLRDGRSYVGVGLPQPRVWLFPGGLAGRALTASQLGQRLRVLGIPAITGRRAALTQLAAHLPPAVLADLVHLDAGTAARWVRTSGGDWANYAALLINDAITNHAE